MERTYQSAIALVSRAAGPLATHLEPWVKSLIDKQYVQAVVYVKARHAVAFDRWLTDQQIELEHLGDIHLTQYQDRRRRVCRPICAATRQQERRELVHLLHDLREQGLCSAAQVDATPADDLAASFGHHLLHQQGLANSSIERYRIVAWQFLTERYGGDAIDLSIVGAADIISFVQRQANHLRPSAMKCVGNGLRSFLRYAQYRGDIAAELVAAVPAVAGWACTPDLPKAIAAEHAQRAIDSCDLTTSIGLRDRAILLLLARLGLRAREIVALRLEDCDWDRAHLLIRGKGRREVLLPLPVDVGEAIAAYLERGRLLARIGICSCVPWHRCEDSCKIPMASARSCATRCSEPRSTRRTVARTSSAMPWQCACCKAEPRCQRSVKCCATAARSPHPSMPGWTLRPYDPWR